MIFVTVGAQMPFDRLIRAVDTWAAKRDRTDLFAQIGPGLYKPKHFPFSAFLTPSEFRRRVIECDVMVAHAGMGSIITAFEHGKPILVLPRRGDLNETRNDHQVATAQQFLAQGRVAAAFDEDELLLKLDEIDALRAGGKIEKRASTELIATLRSFMVGEVRPPIPAESANDDKREDQMRPHVSTL